MTRSARNVILATMASAVLATACQPMSERRADPTAGLNGGFEVVRDGLPVNWLVYGPATVPDADFDFSIDEQQVFEGKRAVRFDVRRCDTIGGWRSPGIAAEQTLDPGRYAVQLAVRGDGVPVLVRAGAVDAKRGEMRDLLRGRESSARWREVHGTVTVTEALPALRLEVNALGPGRLWIDGVSVTPIVE